MKLIFVDVEADGPTPAWYSMVCFGAVALSRDLNETFYGETAAITTNYKEEALVISGFTREEHLNFQEPEETMREFYEWVSKFKRPVFISDNPAFDYMWISYYFDYSYLTNPFGWSARRLGDLFCGYMNDPFYKWKKHRKTKHDHNPVNDAKGNAEAMLWLIDQGFKLKL